MQDVIGALITYLKTVSDITDLTSTRIYGGGLPEADVASMPRQCLVLSSAGGPEEFRTHRIQRQRVDFFSYGSGYLEAGNVDGVLAEALIAIKRTESENTILHSAGYGGRLRLKHPDAGWEYYLRSATILAGETST